LLPQAKLPDLTGDLLPLALGELAASKRSFAELERGGLLDAALARLAPEQARLLRTMTPDRIELPSGRQLKVHYATGKPPWIESRLQDFYGMAKGPTICGGRMPVVLHLLAPNHRAVQVSDDLAGFWQRHYPAVRRELSRKYPRHFWPEDPLHSAPPAPRNRRP
jgi:ATP-dependent helicase HrpB